jgi:hypothetical protein
MNEGVLPSKVENPGSSSCVLVFEEQTNELLSMAISYLDGVKATAAGFWR